MPELPHAFESVERSDRAVLFVLDHDALISVRLNHAPTDPAADVRRRLVAMYRLVGNALRAG